MVKNGLKHMLKTLCNNYHGETWLKHMLKQEFEDNMSQLPWW